MDEVWIAKSVIHSVDKAVGGSLTGALLEKKA
jgi:hypothetical protein